MCIRDRFHWADCALFIYSFLKPGGYPSAGSVFISPKRLYDMTDNIWTILEAIACILGITIIIGGLLLAGLIVC